MSREWATPQQESHLLGLTPLSHRRMSVLPPPRRRTGATADARAALGCVSLVFLVAAAPAAAEMFDGVFPNMVAGGKCAANGCARWAQWQPSHRPRGFALDHYQPVVSAATCA